MLWVYFWFPAQKLLPPGSTPWYLLSFHQSKTRSGLIGKCIHEKLTLWNFFKKKTPSNHHNRNLTVITVTYNLKSILSCFPCKFQVYLWLSFLLVCSHCTIQCLAHSRCSIISSDWVAISMKIYTHKGKVHPALQDVELDAHTLFKKLDSWQEQSDPEILKGSRMYSCLNVTFKTWVLIYSLHSWAHRILYLQGKKSNFCVPAKEKAKSDLVSSVRRLCVFMCAPTSGLEFLELRRKEL